MENPLAARRGPAELGLAEIGPFPLTLRDVFTNTHVLDVTPETTIAEVKELLRAAKGESREYVDAVVLLHERKPLSDDSTVGSHGLSRETTVGLSTQDAAHGRTRREIGEAEAALELPRPGDAQQRRRGVLLRLTAARKRCQ